MSDGAVVTQAAEGLPLVTFVSAFVLVIAVMLALAWIVKRFGLVGGILPGLSAGQRRRLSVVDSLAIDHRRRVVLLRCDDREHLILLGPDHAAVIANSAAAPAALSVVVKEESSGVSA